MNRQYNKRGGAPTLRELGTRTLDDVEKSERISKFEQRCYRKDFNSLSLAALREIAQIIKKDLNE